MERYIEVFNRKSNARKRATMCLHNCNSSVLEYVAKLQGLDTVKKFNTDWDLNWCDPPMVFSECKKLKNYQKTNHFLGMAEIGRKDLLARNLNTMAKYFEDDYNFFPQTWHLPSDYAKLQDYMSSHKATYIVKPCTGSRGKGLYLTRNFKKIVQNEQMICQLYISKLMLMDGYKFDIRVYTLVASCEPLKIYIYNDGLVRLATVPYKKPSDRNMNNTFMHLTNYSVNKNSKFYIDHELVGSKRRISTLNNFLSKNGHDVKKMWKTIDDAIIKTVILAYPNISHSYKSCFSGHLHTQACFELLGFDVILDENCKPYILEVNCSPDLHTSTAIDKLVKRELLNDTFKLLQLNKTYKNTVSAEQKWEIRYRALNADKDVIKQRKIDCKTKYKRQNDEWESKNMGNYRLVLSEKNMSSYEHFFYRNENKLYQNTNRSLLFQVPMMSIQKQLESLLSKEKYATIEHALRSHGPITPVIGRIKRIKSQVFTNKNIFDLTTASSTRSDSNKKIKSIKPVTPHFKIDNSLKIKIRIQTSNITPEIISRISTKRSYQLQIKASKKSVHQIAGNSNSCKMIESMKKNDKKKFSDVQSCLFKHFKKKKCFSSGWVGDYIDLKEENIRLDNMFDRAENVFKLGVKEYIYKAFEKFNNLTEIDCVDYVKYQKKRDFFGYKRIEIYITSTSMV